LGEAVCSQGNPGKDLPIWVVAKGPTGGKATSPEGSLSKAGHLSSQDLPGDPLLGTVGDNNLDAARQVFLTHAGD